MPAIQKQDSQIDGPAPRVASRRVRWARVLLIGTAGSLALCFLIVARHPYIREIRSAWLSERPLADELYKRGGRFNEVIWSTPENGESFLPFQWAYKYYRQIQHIRFVKPDVSTVPFRRLKEFQHLDSIDLSGTNIRADQLAELCDRDWVEIDLCRTKLTREAIGHLVTTNRLQNLSLAGTSVTDDMLSVLAPLKVQVFSLADTQVGDTAMESVGKMPNLHCLSLARTKVGDRGLQLLSSRKFSDLDLSGTAVTDAGISHVLSPGFNLDINLSNTSISDAGLVAFKRLRSVQHLNLANTLVTDAGVEHLKEQISLRWLCLGGTKVTSSGIRSLLRNRQARKDEWRVRADRRTVEPPDLVIIMDRTKTNWPPAYPNHY